jgi:hypothetical protein
MSDASDSQNRSEVPDAEIPDAGTSPDVSSSSDDGERSTPSGLPPVATRTRKHRNSSSEDEDYVAKEVTSKRKVVGKEQQGQQSKKGTSKVKASVATKRKLSLGGDASKVKKTSERKRIVYVQGYMADMFIDPHADAAVEDEAEAPEPVL